MFTNDLDAKRFIEDEYKTKFWEEPEQRAFWAEVMRARWSLHANPGEDAMETLKAYHVTADVIKFLTGELPPPPQPKPRRADKYQTVIDWCMENHLVQVTGNDIAEIGGFSYGTAIKFIKDRPDLFFWVKKGLYEARNPEIMRAQENQ